VYLATRLHDDPVFSLASLMAEASSAVRPGEGSLILFLGYTGLRWGEAVALRYRSVDLLNRRVYITKSATEVAGRLVFGRPKSHRQRTVVVPPSVARLLDLRLSSGGSR
jgi:integrase